MLALLLASSAFHAPMGTHLASSRVASPIMRNNERKGAFWNRADWLEKQPPEPVAPAASTTAVAPKRSSKGPFWERADWIATSQAAQAAAPAVPQTKGFVVGNGQLPAPGVAPMPGVVAAAPAGTATMTVPQACKFMEDNQGVSFAEKKAFLLEKGVSEFVIAQSACVAPDTTLVL